MFSGHVAGRQYEAHTSLVKVELQGIQKPQALGRPLSYQNSASLLDVQLLVVPTSRAQKVGTAIQINIF